MAIESNPHQLTVNARKLHELISTDSFNYVVDLKTLMGITGLTLTQIELALEEIENRLGAA